MMKNIGKKQPLKKKGGAVDQAKRAKLEEAKRLRTGVRIDDTKLPLRRLDRFVYSLEGEQQHQKTERFIRKH